jgi:vitamin B12 transporter
MQVFTHLFNDNFDEVAVDPENNKSILTKDMLYVRKTTEISVLPMTIVRDFITCLNARYIGNRLENDWLTGGEIRPDITSDDYYAKGGYRASDKILQHPAHLIFDYSAFCNLGTHARMGISVANLFDENYTEKDGYNMPGRSIMGHVSYLF